MLDSDDDIASTIVGAWPGPNVYTHTQSPVRGYPHKTQNPQNSVSKLGGRRISRATSERPRGLDILARVLGTGRARVEAMPCAATIAVMAAARQQRGEYSPAKSPARRPKAKPKPPEPKESVASKNPAVRFVVSVIDVLNGTGLQFLMYIAFVLIFQMLTESLRSSEEFFFDKVCRQCGLRRTPKASHSLSRRSLTHKSLPGPIIALPTARSRRTPSDDRRHLHRQPL